VNDNVNVNNQRSVLIHEFKNEIETGQVRPFLNHLKSFLHIDEKFSDDSSVSHFFTQKSPNHSIFFQIIPYF
jgi:hypothetical protein